VAQGADLERELRSSLGELLGFWGRVSHVVDDDGKRERDRHGYLPLEEHTLYKNVFNPKQIHNTSFSRCFGMKFGYIEKRRRQFWNVRVADCFVV
jgi:hypothetical protein